MWLFVKVLAAVVVYGVAIEPRFVNRDNQLAPIPNLPAEWEGKQVAVFADLQVGMWWANKDAARRVVRQVVRIHPALVLIAGDFVYKAKHNVDAQMVEVVKILQPIIDAHIPMYAVLGNHDYELMNENSRPDSSNIIAHRVSVALDSAGIRMMDNRSFAMPPSATDSADSARLYIVGVGEKWARSDHPDWALSKVPAGAPRIVFMHDPDSFAHIPAGEAPIAVAAHTHAMQIDIPFLSDFYWHHFETDEGATGVQGWLKHYGEPGNKLYVNRGIGFSALPIRVHAMPELTVFTLTRARN
jgi:predicted MPP superfamily phosphohydrolase